MGFKRIPEDERKYVSIDDSLIVEKMIGQNLFVAKVTVRHMETNTCVVRIDEIVSKVKTNHKVGGEMVADWNDLLVEEYKKGE